MLPANSRFLQFTTGDVMSDLYDPYDPYDPHDGRRDHMEIWAPFNRKPKRMLDFRIPSAIDLDEYRRTGLCSMERGEWDVVNRDAD
jgi:hypothetical protein